MSFLATLILAWAAVQIYVGLFHGILHLRRRSAREYLAFAVLCFGLAFFCLGAALGTDAGDLAEGTHAARISFVGIAATAGALVDLCMLLVGRGWSRLVSVAYAWAALGLCANLAGLFADPNQPISSSGAFLYHEPQLQPVGLFWVVGACLLAALALVAVVEHVRLDRDLYLLLGAVAVMIAAAVHDVVLHVLGAPHLYSLEHASVLTSCMISYLLLRRFAVAGDELEIRTRELGRSYEELRAMQRELVRKEQLAAVGELSAVIAHEVRNPLAIMKNAVSGLRRATLGDSDRTTLLEILDEEADRLNRLVHDLLAYARPVAPRGDRVEVAELVRDAVDSARKGTAGDAEVTFDLDLSAGPETLHCDRDLLSRALANVVENALQAMPGGGSLSVVSREVDGRDVPSLALEFRDTGEGMDTLVRSKARDPFFTTRPSGTGLGLAIVERMIRAHGGELQIDSRYGSGTTVEVVLPVDRPSAAPETEPEELPRRVN